MATAMEETASSA